MAKTRYGVKCTHKNKKQVLSSLKRSGVSQVSSNNLKGGDFMVLFTIKDASVAETVKEHFYNAKMDMAIWNG